MMIAKHGNIELVVKNEIKESQIRNSLFSIGVKDGKLSLLNKDGSYVPGVRSLKIINAPNELVIVCAEIQVNKEFLICDSIQVRGE